MRSNMSDVANEFLKQRFSIEKFPFLRSGLGQRRLLKVMVCEVFTNDVKVDCLMIPNLLMLGRFSSLFMKGRV